MIVNPQELLKIARSKWPSDRELVKQTKLSRTTIWRMESGRFSFNAGSLAKLVRAINAEQSVIVNENPKERTSP